MTYTSTTLGGTWDQTRAASSYYLGDHGRRRAHRLVRNRSDDLAVITAAVSTQNAGRLRLDRAICRLYEGTNRELGTDPVFWQDNTEAVVEAAASAVESDCYERLPVQA